MTTPVKKNEKIFRTPYGVKQKVTLSTPEETRTKQSFKEECDINHILNRYQKTGILPELRKTNPRYGDFSNVTEYHDSLNIVMKAQEQFQALGARVRERFQNNPEALLAFVNDPKNKEEAIRLGLIDKPVEPVPTPPKEGSGSAGKPAETDPSNKA